MLLLAAAALACAAAGQTAPAAPGRLASETSPFLRQHASDLVDWYPWGTQAFEKARREGRPIFLSVGYSTCHWCHVMERESFSDPEVAALLNADYVPVLVDREERPDIDRLYMTFVQASTGSGGWPLSVWLTPDLKPFLGGTYFGPETQPGRPSFKSVLARVTAMWRDQRDQVVQGSEQMLAALAVDTGGAAAPGALPVAALRSRALAQVRASFDAEHGGFEDAPKFPQASLLEFLLDTHATSPDAAEREQALGMALKTLRAIADGGIHDLLGGGFHRYAVDAAWRVPHFEKMLADQAQLASLYAEAWQAAPDPRLEAAARDTLGYVQRELCSPDGGFYSAEDADSAAGPGVAAHAEGAFYVWTAAEVERALGARNAAVFDYAFGVEPGGNTGADAPAGLTGENVLYRARTAAECAATFGMGEADARSLLENTVRTLGEARDRRPRPARDDKVVTAWNGLAISAFARAAQVWGDPGFAASAVRAAAFAQARLFDPASGRLSRTLRAGARDNPGFAEDYAFLVQGLLDLYETTFDLRWLKWAVRLQEKQIDLFGDASGGGFYANAGGDPSVLLRLKGDIDDAEPSANSVSVRNLARLSAMLNRPEWRDLAARTARALGPELERAPTGLPQMLAAAGWLEGSPREIVIHGALEAPGTSRLVAEVWRRYLPRHVLMLIDPDGRAYFEPRLPIVADLPRDGAPTAYVCENFACQLPTHDPAALARMLDGAPPPIR